MIVDQGINVGMVIILAVNFTILTALLVLPVLALIKLFRNRPGSDLEVVLWVLVILAFPILGPLAFIASWLIRPADSPPESTTEPHAG